MGEIKYRSDSEMVDSGVEWLGEIPEDWELKKMRYLTHIDTGNKDTQDREENGIYPFYVRSDTVERISSYSYDGEAVLTAGDGVGVGRVFHYANEKFDFHQRVYKLSDFNHILGKYLYYFISENFHKEVMKLSAKSTVDSLRRPMFSNFPVTFPDIENQQKVISFLDIKTAELDRVIAKKEELIAKLEEAKKSLISEVVTGKSKIVDGKLKSREDSEMKDSEVEWLGEIPKNWTVKRLKHMLSEPMKYGANESAELDNENLPRYIRITDFGNNGELRVNTFKSLEYEKAVNYMLKEGDILFARSGATVGKTFQFKGYKGKACFAGYLIKAVVNKKIVESDFLYYFTNSLNYENWKNSIFIQATIQNIGADKYQELKLALPDLIEQKIVIDYLDIKTLNMSKLIDKIRLQIQKLKEAKQSLISEAVTGKIDLRDWQIIEEGERE